MPEELIRLLRSSLISVVSSIFVFSSWLTVISSSLVDCSSSLLVSSSSVAERSSSLIACSSSFEALSSSDEVSYCSMVARELPVALLQLVLELGDHRVAGRERGGRGRAG